MMLIRQRHQGFTLVELMIGLLIGLFLMGGVISLFVQTKASSRQNELLAGMQDNARFALAVLADDLRSGGFMGGVLSLSEIDASDTSLGTVTDHCGSSSAWTYDTSAPLTITTDAADHACLSSASPAAGDILTIKRTFGEPKTGGLTSGSVYLHSNGETGCLWYYDGTSTPTSAGCPAGVAEDWMYLNHVYYIESGDVPQLCRYALGAGPAMTQQCLARGIERFHIEWGEDNDSPGDGVVDLYTSDPSDMARVVAARIYVLARSSSSLPSKPTSNKDYRLGSVTITHDDRFYRRVYSTTVLLRNTVNRANLR